MASSPHKFTAKLRIIGINPYLVVPAAILKAIFKAAGKDKGPVPICGFINDKPYKQTLVKYAGAWRLYVNTMMLKDSPTRIGELLEVQIEYDPVPRTIKPHPEWVKALKENPDAKSVFDQLPPSRKHEIVRYLDSLKTKASIDRNIVRAISFLRGNERFVGRDKP